MGLGDLRDAPVWDNDDVYMRRFKDEKTRIRILPATGQKVKGLTAVTVYGTEAWPWESEHYHPQLKSFPCVAPDGLPCGGCTDPNSRVSKRKRQYYINALDVSGEVRIFKFGAKLMEFLVAAEARFPEGPQSQPLSGRDYWIYRIGIPGDLNTTYYPEAVENSNYEIDFTQIEGHNIKAVLEAQAAKAYTFYFDAPAQPAQLVQQPAQPAVPGTVVNGPGRPGQPPQQGQIVPQGQPQPHQTTGEWDRLSGQQPGGQIVPKSLQGKPTKEPAAVMPQEMAEFFGMKSPAGDKTVSAVDAAHQVIQAEQKVDVSTWGPHPTSMDFEEGSNADIRDWLTGMNVEFPPRANRALLIKTATSVADRPDA